MSLYLASISTDDNFMNLVLGYNGSGRVLGHNHHGGPGSRTIGRLRQRGHGFGGFGNQTQACRGCSPASLDRLAGPRRRCQPWCWCWCPCGRAPRTDAVRAWHPLFGGWLLVDGLVLSFSEDQRTPTTACRWRPRVAGMFAIGIAEMWHRRTDRFGAAAWPQATADHRRVGLVDLAANGAWLAVAALE